MLTVSCGDIRGREEFGFHQESKWRWIRDDQLRERNEQDEVTPWSLQLAMNDQDQMG